MTDTLPPPQSEPQGQHEQKVHEAPQIRKSSLTHIIVGVFCVFAVVAAVGIVMRVHQAHALRQSTDQNAIPPVATIVAKQGAQSEEIALPGTVQAWHEATIYARTSGYIKTWNTDIGARVKAGDVLAEIDAPDLDAQYHQAQADLATAQANNKLAQLTAKRNVELRKTDSVSQQTADQAIATAEADAATVASQQANLDHLQQQEDFKKVVAPFDGVVTQRNVDVGALVVGDTGGTSGQDLFHVAQTDRLRVYVQVPELNAAAVTSALTAELHFPQNPQQAYSAKLSRTANALDPTTRTLLVELEVDNADGALMPGGYIDAHLKIPQSGDAIILPVNALLFRDIERVGIVHGDKVSLQPVKIGRDFGKTVEILSGVSAGDVVVVNPPDSLQDGEQVKPITQKNDTNNQDTPKAPDQTKNAAPTQTPPQAETKTQAVGEDKTSEKVTIDQNQANQGANNATPVGSSGLPQTGTLKTTQGNEREQEQSPNKKDEPSPTK